MTITPEQLRHAQAMARKIEDYALRMVAQMNDLQKWKPSSVQHMPLERLENKFGHDTGCGIVDFIESIEAVISEMLPELIDQ